MEKIYEMCTNPGVIDLTDETSRPSSLELAQMLIEKFDKVHAQTRLRATQEKQ